MRKQDVEVGKMYAVKVSGKMAPVRIDRVSPYGGYDGINIRTGRSVRLRTAGRLQYELELAPEGSAFKYRKVG